MAASPTANPIDAVAALGDPGRRRLHEAVRQASHPLSREEAAAAVGISRKLAAFHLDKLVAVGLLKVAERRSQPHGVGRAPKLYEPVEEVVAVSVPPRAHDELASILVDVVDSRGHELTAECHASASTRGAARGATFRAVADAERGGGVGEDSVDRVRQCLAEHGYEPYHAESGVLRLRNCPFHPLAEQATELVCGINLGYVAGLLDGMQVPDIEASLAPATGECCVELRTVETTDRRR